MAYVEVFLALVRRETETVPLPLQHQSLQQPLLLVIQFDALLLRVRLGVKQGLINVEAGQHLQTPFLRLLVRLNRCITNLLRRVDVLHEKAGLDFAVHLAHLDREGTNDRLEGPLLLRDGDERVKERVGIGEGTVDEGRDARGVVRGPAGRGDRRAKVGGRVGGGHDGRLLRLRQASERARE